MNINPSQPRWLEHLRCTTPADAERKPEASTSGVEGVVGQPVNRVDWFRRSPNGGTSFVKRQVK